MIKNSASSGLLIEQRAHRREASKLLSAGQYDSVAQLLLNHQRASQKRGDVYLAQILGATRRICLACRQHRMQIEWHRQAYLEIRDREEELKRELQTMLDSIGRLETSDGIGRRSATGAAVRVEAGRPETDAPFSAKAATLVQSIRTLLRQRSSLRALRRAPSAAPVGGTAELGIAEDQTPADPLQALECEPARLSASEIKARREDEAAAMLLIYCLGPFQIYSGDHPIEDWPNGKGKSIFKYLVAHRDRPVSKDVLMDLFWPDAEAHAARNNLNVTIYGLRHAIAKANPRQSYVLFRDDHYLLNPELSIWTDFESFTQNITTARGLDRTGEVTLAVQSYRAAEALYQGEFLEEDRYEDWLLPLRQQLQEEYLYLLDRLYRYYFELQHYNACTVMCKKILAVDSCHEKAHRRLMRCYSKQGQPYLALRQYQSCKTSLARELDVLPSKPTLELYEKIRHQQPL